MSSDFPSQSGAARRAVVVAFASAVGPVAILGLPFSVYLPPFIAEGGVVPIALIGLLFSISTLWDGVIDPLIGGLIDRKSHGAGAHRSWMAGAALPLALFLALLVIVGDQLPFWQLLALLLLFYSSQSIMEVAHLTWGSALAAGNADTSARLFGGREHAAKFFLVAAFGAPALAQLLIPDLSLQGRVFAYASLAIPAILIALIAIYHIPLRPVLPEAGIGWRVELGLTIRSKPLMLILMVHFFNAFAFGGLASTFIFFADAYLGLEHRGSILLFLTFVGGAFTVPFWTWLARTLGKPKGMMVMAATLVVLLGLTFFLPFAGNFALTAGYTVLLGSAFMGLIFIYGMIADFAPVDAKLCGRDRTAFIFAMGNLMQKGGNAAALAIAYALLDAFGFDPSQPQHSGTLVRNIWAGLPIAGWLLCGAGLTLLAREPWTKVGRVAA